METRYFDIKPELGKVDLENGECTNVSLVTSGEVLGHNMFLNEAGIDSFIKCVEDTQVKAYYKHSDQNEALSSIGYFENFKKVKTDESEYKVVGDFTALNAWKTNNEKEYSTFFELAEKAPEVFGISLEGLINTGYYNSDEELVMVENEMPEEGTKLYAFCEKILALSVVSTPATNPNGLFSVDVEADIEQSDKDEIREKLIKAEEGEDEESECEDCPMEERIDEMQKQIDTLMELTKEIRNEKDSVEEENKELVAQVKDLKSKLESFELGNDGVEHNFIEEPVDLGKQIELETDWARKSKLIMGNLNSLKLERTRN